MNNLFFNFEIIFNDFLKKYKKYNIAIALSGGIDSMCLLNLIIEYKKLNPKINLAFLTVNHNLRSNSVAEVLEINEYCKNLNLNHYILDWKNENLSGNIQSLARENRYKLLTKWVVDNNFDTILTAHHLNDQFENILINLSQGSSIYGLLINDLYNYNNVQIFRPLITIPKNSLYEYANNHKIKFWQDESNFSNKYLRNKLRIQSDKIINLFPENDLKRFNRSFENIKRACISLDNISEKFISNNVYFSKLGYLKFDRFIFYNLEKESRLSVLKKLISIVRGFNINLRLDSLLILDESLKSGNKIKKNLAECFFEMDLKNEKILLYRKWGKISPNSTNLRLCKIWDRRYKISSFDDNLSVTYISENEFIKYKKDILKIINFDCDLSYSQRKNIFLSLPIIKKNEKILSFPLFNCNFDECNIQITYLNERYVI